MKYDQTVNLKFLEVQRSTKNYKGKTDRNSLTGPNEAVRVATLLL